MKEEIQLKDFISQLCTYSKVFERGLEFFGEYRMIMDLFVSKEFKITEEFPYTLKHTTINMSNGSGYNASLIFQRKSDNKNFALHIKYNEIVGDKLIEIEPTYAPPLPKK